MGLSEKNSRVNKFGLASKKIVAKKGLVEYEKGRKEKKKGLAPTQKGKKLQEDQSKSIVFFIGGEIVRFPKVFRNLLQISEQGLNLNRS